MCFISYMPLTHNSDNPCSKILTLCSHFIWCVTLNTLLDNRSILHKALCVSRLDPVLSISSKYHGLNKQRKFCKLDCVCQKDFLPQIHKTLSGSLLRTFPCFIFCLECDCKQILFSEPDLAALASVSATPRFNQALGVKYSLGKNSVPSSIHLVSIFSPPSDVAVWAFLF